MVNTNFTPFPILTTDRLILRPLEITDADAIISHRSEDIVNTFLEDFRHSSIDQTLAFIDRVQKEITDGKTILWVIRLKESNQFIGSVCFWNISKYEHTAETGYTLAAEFHKKGIMNEALAKIIDFGFTKMKLKTIEAYTHTDNMGSIKLLLKNNFRQGLPRKDAGKNRVYFSLTNSEASM